MAGERAGADRSTKPLRDGVLLACVVGFYAVVVLLPILRAAAHLIRGLSALPGWKD